MNARTSLWASLAIAASLGLAGCGGSSDNDDGAGTQPPPASPPASPKVDVSEKISLSKAQMAALLAVLPDTGDSVALESGESRAAVTFTCASGDDPCSITVENSAGTIVAMAHSTTAGAVSGTAAGLAKDVVDTFEDLNDGNTASIRKRLNDDPNGSPPRAIPDWMNTEIIGMGIGGPGVLPEDAETDAGLRSSLQMNGADATGSAAIPGATPGLVGGTTITGGVDEIRASPDMAPAPDGWEMVTLFRDWGDTAGDGDGGFETGAIVVTNLEGGTQYPFDRKLADKYVNSSAQMMFALTIQADGMAPGVTTLATSVRINHSGAPATSVQWANMEFHADSLVPAQSQDLRIDVDETFTGTYFGASGQFRCIDGGRSNETCALARSGDKVVVNDTNPAKDVVNSTGTWSFTPDPGAMITVPDQDWIAYGAWLTTPDGKAGDHRFGIVFNGMDTYEPAADALDATNSVGLRGSATYKGGATGVYADRTVHSDGAHTEHSGLFTADATLTADFDKATNGADDAEDYMISGRIDNFRGTNGRYLGTDTIATPNDPNKGGENDWVVLLGAADFGTTTTGAFTPPAGMSATGSADGVPWHGMWNGQFFGPSVDADGDTVHPSGVAGRFWANTGDPDGAGQLTDKDAVTSVVGTFGATKQ